MHHRHKYEGNLKRTCKFNETCLKMPFISFLLAHLWCAYAIPLALSVVRRPSSVVCVVPSNLTTADMKEII